MKRNQLATLAMVAVLPLLLACEQTDDAGDPQDTATVDTGADRTDTNASPISLVAGADVEFASVDRSGITGTVRGEEDGDDAAVTLELEGLEAGTGYPAHIHSGRCVSGGPVVAPLGDVTGDEDGAGELTADVPADALSGDEQLFVQVHGPDGDAVACADLDDENGTGNGPGDSADPATEEDDLDPAGP